MTRGPVNTGEGDERLGTSAHRHTARPSPAGTGLTRKG
jgi:hypothetical protein